MKFTFPFKFGKSKKEESAPEKDKPDDSHPRPKPTIQFSITDQEAEFVIGMPGPSTGSWQPTGPDNWRESDAHMELLGEFRRFIPLDFYRTYSDDLLVSWNKVLGESMESAIKRFYEDALVEKVSQFDLMGHQYTVAKLKPLLRERGLKVSGRKAELIDRLFEADSAGMDELLAGMELYTCSEQGKALVDDYQERVQREKETAERTAYEAIQEGRLETACKAISDFEAGRVFPRGMGINWVNYVPERDVSLMRMLFKLAPPELLGEVATDDLLRLAVAAAMMHLLGENKGRRLWAVKDIHCGHLEDGDVAARMMWFQAHHVETVLGYQGRDVGYVEVHSANDPDVCMVCRKLGDKRFPLRQAPLLPYKHCTCPWGCRCHIAIAYD